MKVMFFGYIRDFTGTKEIQIDSVSNLKRLLQHLCLKFGKPFSEKVWRGEDITDEVIILVNGRNIAFTGGVDTVLSDDDEISIFPIVAGG